ncbi:MAG: translin family protein, partial [Candidatus Methylomirabilales bacterium]
MDLGTIRDKLRSNLDAKYAAREKALALCREAIRLSSNAIRAVHRAERAEAQNLLDQALASLSKASGATANHPDVKYAGFYHDAAK